MKTNVNFLILAVTSALIAVMLYPSNATAAGMFAGISFMLVLWALIDAVRTRRSETDAS